MASGSQGRGGNRFLTLVLTLALVGILAGGLFLIYQGTRTSEPEAAPLPEQEFKVKGKVPQLSADAECTAAVETGPNRVVIPRLCISTKTVATDIVGSALVIPNDINEAGVWSGGPDIVAASARRGTTLVAGHVHSPGQGNGALFNLAQVQPGDLIESYDDRGVVSRWRVSELRAIHRESLPRDVYNGMRGQRRMVLVTCGGKVTKASNGTNVYEDNIIVTAVPENSKAVSAAGQDT